MSCDISLFRLDCFHSADHYLIDIPPRDRYFSPRALLSSWERRSRHAYILTDDVDGRNNLDFDQNDDDLHELLVPNHCKAFGIRLVVRSHRWVDMAVDMEEVGVDILDFSFD